MAIDDPLIEKDQLLVGGKGLVPQIFAAFLAGDLHDNYVVHARDRGAYCSAS